MTYSRMLQPRFYMDNPNWLVSRGLARSTIFSNNTGAGFDTFNTGYNVYQLFDGDPLNLCSFDTSTGTDTVSIKIDYTVVAMPTDFVCIMNHNLATAAGKIRVAHSTSPITTVGGGTAVTFTEIFNGDVSGEFATPDTDYDTNIRPSNMRSPASGANYLHDVVNKSGGELLRFIFTPDSTSTTEGDYLWARFDQPDFRTTRQAWGVETFRTRIVQEF
jgi:hypothetical protein